MELSNYDNSRLSIKDFEGDIKISSKKWDDIFNFLLLKTNAVYFLGNRLEYADKDLSTTIDFLLADCQIIKDSDYYNVALKIKLSSIMFSRGLIEQLWIHYEYPCLVFLKKELKQADFVKLSTTKYYKDFFSFLEEFYILYKSFETNVLWIEKSSDMDNYDLPSNVTSS